MRINDGGHRICRIVKAIDELEAEGEPEREDEKESVPEIEMTEKRFHGAGSNPPARQIDNGAIVTIR